MFRNLFRNRRRTMAILLTVALGTGALFSFDGFIHGVLHDLRNSTIHSHYGHGEIHTKGYHDTVFETPTNHWIQNSREVENFLSRLNGVEYVFPRVSFSALLKHEKRTIAVAGQGIEAVKEAEFFHALNIEEGIPLQDQPNGILVGKGVADALQVHPKDTITVIATSPKGMINKGKFIITGIFHTGSQEFDNRVVRIPLLAAQKLLKSSFIESISLGLSDLSDWNDIAKEITSAFPYLEASPFNVLDEIYYQHSVDWLNAQFRVVQIIILFIVLLGIFNTLSTTILERKQEIGNLRANGQSIKDIMKLIMGEGSILALLGSIIGMIGAYLLLMLFSYKGILMPPGPGQTRQSLLTFSFEWSMVGMTLFFSFLSALIASFWAGIKVAKMPIAQSLRSY
ncbi:MAG: ABC transporter permease [Parachlamydiales bacterium]|nr:ABC transporter permease [Parachlamydiales bacterium]